MTATLFDDAFLRKLEYLYIVARRVFAGRVRAERRSRKIGAGLEFADHRDYARGDDPRYLDWNVVGRLDRLLVRLFEEEEDLFIYLLLDTSKSMGVSSFDLRLSIGGEGPAPIENRQSSIENCFDFARQLTAALAYIGLANLDRVSVAPFAGACRPALPPQRGKRQIHQVFHFLESLAPSGETSLAAAFREFVSRTPRPGLAVVIGDLLDPAGFETGLKALQGGRFEVFVIETEHAAVLPSAAHGADVALTDAETGAARAAVLTAGSLRRFAAAYQRYRTRLARFCLSRGMGFVSAPVTVPFEQAILDVFRRGGFLK